MNWTAACFIFPLTSSGIDGSADQLTHITGAGSWRRDGRPVPWSRCIVGPSGRSRRADRERRGGGGGTERDDGRRTHRAPLRAGPPPDGADPGLKAKMPGYGETGTKGKAQRFPRVRSAAARLESLSYGRERNAGAGERAPRTGQSGTVRTHLGTNKAVKDSGFPVSFRKILRSPTISFPGPVPLRLGSMDRLFGSNEPMFQYRIVGQFQKTS